MSFTVEGYGDSVVEESHVSSDAIVFINSYTGQREVFRYLKEEVVQDNEPQH